MNLIRLTVKETSYRKSNFLLSCFAVSVAVTSVVAAFSLLKIHDIKTKHLLDRKVAETETQIKAIENDIGKIARRKRCNILILPANQNLDDFYSDNCVSEFMPESYVNKLTSSRVLTARHLLPTLEQEVKWPEKSRTVILVGTRGEGSFIHKDSKKSIIRPVEPGTVILGNNLAEESAIKRGDKIFFMGYIFSVAKVYNKRSNRDDITIWMDLKQAQELLHRNGQINAVLALECILTDIDTLKKELHKIVPKTKIVTFADKAEVRKAARSKVEIAARDSMKKIKANRSDIRRGIEKSTSLAVPLIILLSSIWVAILAFLNIRERRYETGLMFAVGIKAKKLLTLFMVRAFMAAVIGLIDGLILGSVIAIIIGCSINGLPLNTQLMNIIFTPELLGGTVLLTPLLTFISSWAPAIYASQQDPAEVLRKEQENRKQMTEKNSIC